MADILRKTAYTKSNEEKTSGGIADTVGAVAGISVTVSFGATWSYSGWSQAKWARKSHPWQAQLEMQSPRRQARSLRT